MHNCNNSKLASIFKQMSLMYRYSGNIDRFRAISYERASKVIENMKEDVSEMKYQNQLENLKGIGKSIAEKIIEFLNTGKIKRYEELKNAKPWFYLLIIP
jgi:DNA polymerase (family 10)